MDTERTQDLPFLDAAKDPSEGDAGNGIESLERLKNILLQSQDPSHSSEIFRRLADLQTVPSAPVRKHLAEIAQEIGCKRPENLPEIIPVLSALLNDGTPAVVRQSIAGGAVLLRKALEADTWRRRFADEVFQSAFRRPGTPNGVKFVAAKFLETAVLVFTRDPENGGFSSAAGHVEEEEAGGKNLGLMLEILVEYSVTKTSVAVVVINGLAEIAKRRPALCSRVLTELLGLTNPSAELAHGHMPSTRYALKSAFLALLRCAHWGALPWRDRLLEALRAMDAGDAAEQALRRAHRKLREKSKTHLAKEKTAFKETVSVRHIPSADMDEQQLRAVHGRNIHSADVDGKQLKAVHARNIPSADVDGKQLKAPNADVEGERTVADVEEERLVPALRNLTVRQPEDPLQGKGREPLDVAVAHVDKDTTCPVQKMIAVIGALLAQGEKGCQSIEILIPKMGPDLLADVVIASMSNLPSRPADVAGSRHCQADVTEVVSRAGPAKV
uniref:Symplekin/Pta1 N-terminal domain-containing protein n=1 Tax=Araucaria cunninghamii TaxID=56994 RepID=A0A0D6QYV0_ARACU